MKLFILIGSILLGSAAHAGLRVNVGIVRKKGIDKGLVLVSELHSAEQMAEGEEMRLEMQNGLVLKLTVEYLRDESSYGPSAMVGFRGYLFPDRTESVGTPLTKEGLVTLNIGETKKISLSSFNSDEGQLVEVTLSPNYQ